MTGLHISLLGIDGIGKSSLAAGLKGAFEARGHTVRRVSWREELPNGGVWPALALQQLWLESFRLIYGGSKVGGDTLQLPRAYSTWESEGWEGRIGSAEIYGTRPVGPLAGALVELAGNFVLQSEVIQPALNDGVVVIQETYPVKHVLKELALAEQLDVDGALTQAIAEIGTLTTRLFGSSVFHPDVGLWLDGDPRLAYRWRMAQNGRTGLLEDFGAAGQRGESSYLAMQTMTAKLYEELATEWKWTRLEVIDDGVGNTIARGVDLVFSHDVVTRWIHHEGLL